MPAAGVLAAPNGQPIEIPAILSLTGPAAFLGKNELSALQLVEEQVNTEGGIAGRPLHFAVQDDQTNAQTAVQIANGMISKGAPVIIGPSLTAACGAIAPLFKNGPVDYCLSPGMHPEKDSWIYSWGPITTELIALNIAYFREHGGSASPVDDDRRERTRWGTGGRCRSRAAREQRRNAGGTRTFQRQRFERRGASGAHKAVRRPSDAGLGNRDADRHGVSCHRRHRARYPGWHHRRKYLYALLKQYSSILPRRLVSAAFPAAAAEYPQPGIFANAVKRYSTAFATIGVRPDASQVIGWDPAWIIVGAYRKLGPTPTADQIKQYLSTLRGFVGATGVYDFVAVPQRGLSISESGLMVGWDAAKNSFVPLGKIGRASN